MADNRLNKTGLRYLLTKLNGFFAKQTDLTALDTKVDGIIAEGGEPNVIETVKVNGTALTPDAQKAVDIPVPEEVFVAIPNTSTAREIRDALYANKAIIVNVPGADPLPAICVSNYGSDSAPEMKLFMYSSMWYPDPNVILGYTVTDSGWSQISVIVKLASDTDIPAATSDLTNDGDGTSPFATQDYVGENGGKIQKIKNNGTDMPIDSSDKSVNFTNATSSADGLMSSSDKSKLDGISAGAEANVQANWNESDSTSDAFIANKPTIPTRVSELTNDGDGTQGSTFATSDEVEDAIAEQLGKVYQPKGTTTFANLPAASASTLSHVYNVTDAFTTTADFKEGAGISYPAGTNVAIINDGTEQSPVYKYDALSGVVDLSDYWNTTNLPALTTAEIDEVWNSVFNPTTP